MRDARGTTAEKVVFAESWPQWRILAVLVAALECSDNYEISEDRGELFITARLGGEGHEPPMLS